MAQRTLVGGTGYDVLIGRTLVGGTGYDVEGGRTLVGGTGYDISVGKKITFSIYYDSEYAMTSPGSLFGTFTAIEGMTWREWCASSYNTSSLHIASESIAMDMDLEFYDEDVVATNNSHYIGWVEQQWNDDEEEGGWYDVGYWNDPDEVIVDGTRYNLIYFLGIL